MIDPLNLTFSLIAGMMLGVFFFGGLLWTVRRSVLSRHAALWFIGSLVLRMGIVVLGFYWILGDSWQRLLAGLFGFVVARLIVTRLTREAEQPDELAREAGHAP